MDRNHTQRTVVFTRDGITGDPLQEPLVFDSHRDAKRYYGWSSDSAVWLRVQWGWAYDIGGPCPTPKNLKQAQNAGLSLAQAESKNTGMNLTSTYERSRSIEVTDPNGNTWIEQSLMECERNIGVGHDQVSYTARHGGVVRKGRFRGWQFKYI